MLAKQPVPVSAFDVPAYTLNPFPGAQNCLLCRAGGSDLVLANLAISQHASLGISTCWLNRNVSFRNNL